MSWHEKLETLRHELPGVPLMFVFDVAEPAPEEFIKQVREIAPYVPQSYLDFLSLTDGAQMDYFVLFGSGRSQFPSLMEEINGWREVLDVKTGLVIGKDASGATFFIMRDGRIILVRTDAPDLDAAQSVALNFDDLLDQVFMGPRYFDLFPRGVRPGNEWVQVLEKQGWAQAM